MTDATRASPAERELKDSVMRLIYSWDECLDQPVDADLRPVGKVIALSFEDMQDAYPIAYREIGKRAEALIRLAASAADTHGIVEALRPFVKEAERLLPKLSHLSDEHVMRPTITLGELRVLLDAARSAAGEVGS